MQGVGRQGGRGGGGGGFGYGGNRGWDGKIYKNSFPIQLKYDSVT